MNHLDRAEEVFTIEIEALQAVKSQLGSSFGKAVDVIAEALRQRGKLVVVGIGKSGNIAQKIVGTLTSTGSTAVVLNSVDALHGDLGIINDGDVIIPMSYSGESEELLQLLPAIKRFDVTIIAFTGSPTSTLARFSDLVLNVQVPREACPFNLAPTSSTSAMLVMGDALAMAVLSARGFCQRDFAKHHPSGSIGRALLLKVSDIMRTGSRNPIAQADWQVKEALLEMTRAKAGSVAVTDTGGRLVGVFTDGDLRRLMAGEEDVLSKQLSEVMSPSPINIRQDLLAVEALRVFNNRSIDDLIVIDDDQRPVGIVDLQDLPKLKLV